MLGALTALLFLAVALIGLMTARTANAAPGDQWVLPIDHTDGSGFSVWSGEGYGGTDALEGAGQDPVRRIYWALKGTSVTTSVEFPTTTELYTIEWYQSSAGASDWQPLESQFSGSAGETWPNDPRIPWAGTAGTNHQYIGADGNGGTPGEWTATGPGPHTPAAADFNASDAGVYMWLTQGSWIYAKWDFGWSIDHTWSALRLTQVTGPVAPTFNRGDANTDSATDIADAIFTLSYLFASGSAPSCLDTADANDDGAVDIADAIAVLSYLFAGTGDLPAPFGECGVDPTVDELGCLVYEHCQQ